MAAVDVPAAAQPTEKEIKTDTDQELCRYLDKVENRGTPLRSAWCLVQTLVAFAAWWAVAATQTAEAPTIARVGLGVVWGLFVLRSYMIFHDCGHGSFFQGFKTLNWMTLHLSSVMCGTPTDWNVGHALHHANVGNLGQDDYDWGETIFHLASTYVNLAPWKQRLWKMIRHPLPFFLLAPALTWYFKMRLPFEFRPERKAAYRLNDKVLNLATIVVRYGLARRLGICDMVLGGDYLAMFTGVLLFHWQHVYETGYVRYGDEWKLRYAAMHGSSIITVPECLKWFTLGIEYHHIHHFRTRVPGYMLRSVHEAAPVDMWHKVVTLYPRDMWRSIWLQVYDESTRTYATFDEVLERHAAKKVKAM